ncbi:MAG: transglycosylase SLT domain-containing protein, partial [Anaerolineaceae bacterium]
LLTIILFVSGCTLPQISNPSEASQLSQTPTPVKPTSTPLPTFTPTATPTPLPAARIELGNLLIINGDYDQAMTDYQNAYNQSDDADIKTQALLGIGRTQYLSGDCNSAITTLNSIPQEDASDETLADANFFLAECLFQKDAFQESATAFENFLKYRPGIIDDVIYEKQGDALMAAGNPQAAIIAYQSALQSVGSKDPTSIETKIGNAYSAAFDYINAVRQFMAIYDSTTNEYTKAQMDLLAGQAYLNLGIPDQAYARFQDAVENYPRSYDTYSGLVALVNADIPVNEFNRGLIDYYAGQYGLAVEAFYRYINLTPDHDGTALYYAGLALQAMNQPEDAITEWQKLIAGYPDNRFYIDAWEDIAYTQWTYLDQYEQGAQTLLDFIELNSYSDQAPDVLYEAGRIFERGNFLTKATETWLRLIDEYPNQDISSRALFSAGITSYRLENYEQALVIFQRYLLLSVSAEDQSAANLWIGKTYQIMGNSQNAQSAWQQASTLDPTGYYSERAGELLNNESPMTSPTTYDLAVNLKNEQSEAERWMRKTFDLPIETDFSGLGSLSNNPELLKADLFWELGQFQLASNLYENLRESIGEDPLSLYQLTNHFLDIGLYRSAIYSSRQILDLAKLSDAQTLNAPKFFNHIRFGTYYQDIVINAAQETGFHPLFLFSVIRQESLFEGFASSSSGAHGAMQIMPATGAEIAKSYNWPLDYSEADLDRPYINIRLGAEYLSNQRDYFGGDLYLALSAYNAGPGNTLYWEELAKGDPDLFLEVVRFEETRNYIMQIAEFHNIYRIVYERNP